jgi:penicillin-binding protein 2
MKSGAAVALDVRNGEILAMASYPTYDPAQFNQNYDELIHDPDKPMLNRALNGTYPPASTFKMVTAVAGLETSVITPKEIINDTGVYNYYAPTYTPKCWKRGGHGRLNVAQAIMHSCNYFFYETGRRVGIEKLNFYSTALGLGVPTGIELSESSGILAGPDYRKKINGDAWMPGNTVQAAIGQSDNSFTPIQLASYIATLANGGTRYRLHLIKEIKNYETQESVKTVELEALSEINIKPENYAAVMEGVKGVTANGTASSVFYDFPVTLGGKTGTAQVYGHSDNAVFVGFGPFDDPEIAVAVVFEGGLHGSYAAYTARDIFSEYFGV